MPWSIDARVPVRLGSRADLEPGDAVLAESAVDEPAGEHFDLAGPHGAGCTCCAARSPAAVALDRLFLRRVRGEIAFFRRVVAVTATAEGDLAVWSALRDDPVVSARYRWAD